MKCWTDGSCIGNPGPGGWAVVFGDGREVYGFDPETTNNRMELTAILEALEQSTGPLTVYTDSQLSQNVIDRTWKAKVNLDLLESIWGAMEGRMVRIRWVRGHAGHVQNERADTLAWNAAKMILR